MSQISSTQIQPVACPQGWSVPEDFRAVSVGYGDLLPDQVRARGSFISPDPCMRGRVNDSKGHVLPFTLGEAVVDGIERAMDALLGMTRGANTVKTLVRTAQDA